MQEAITTFKPLVGIPGVDIRFDPLNPVCGYKVTQYGYNLLMIGIRSPENAPLWQQLKY